MSAPFRSLALAPVLTLVAAAPASSAPSGGTCFGEQAAFEASQTSSFLNYGRSVDVSGDTAAVGGPYLHASGGFVDVFVRDGSSWSWQARLEAGDDDGDAFGYSVAIQGDTAVVGAPAAHTAGVEIGAVYFFVRVGTEWIERAKLVPGDGAGGDDFGSAVALDGDTLLVGSIGDDGHGSARVYVFDGMSWSFQVELVPSQAATAFGYSLSLSGDRALIGDPWANAPDFRSGTAFVFVRDGASWSEEAQLVAADGAAADFFGYSVAISGETAIVGAYLDDHPPVAADIGSAYVFVRDTQGWQQEARLGPSDPLADDRFGSAVALSGDRALVGCPRDDAPFNSGSVYVFDRVGSSWQEVTRLRASDGVAQDELGRSVAFDNGLAVAGAPVAGDVNENRGAAYAWSAPAPVGTSFCACTAGPCGNASPGAGCANSTGSGARLALVGTTLPDTLSLIVSGARPSQPAIFFQGTSAVMFPFGDGFRCAGGAVERITAAPIPIASDGSATFGPCAGDPTISSITGAVPGSGDTLRYQFWYRDPGGPCASNFNLSNGCEITW